MFYNHSPELSVLQVTSSEKCAQKKMCLILQYFLSVFIIICESYESLQYFGNYNNYTQVKIFEKFMRTIFFLRMIKIMQ